MLFSDTYLEPQKNSSSVLREKGSRFLSFVFPVTSESEARLKLIDVKSKYPDATHHCYAYVINPDKSAQRSADDGEPSNSAGKPILRAIMAADLTNILVVVVRYFGGTMLGIPGLIQAYGGAATQAIKQAGAIEKYLTEELTVRANFENEQAVYRLVTELQAEVTERVYSEVVVVKFRVRKNKANEAINRIKSSYGIALQEQLS